MPYDGDLHTLNYIEIELRMWAGGDVSMGKVLAVQE